MDTNGDLGIMSESHVGHLQITPEFLRGLWIEKRFLIDREGWT